MSRLGEASRGWMTMEVALLFGVALAARAILSISQIVYGQQGVPGLPLSTWNDFYTTYALWLGYVQHGLLPYRDFPVYKYTPLFLYSLYPFYAAGGAMAASIPIVVSDAATAVVVYLIVGRLAGGKIAFAAGLIYAFSPFALNYEGYLWLSSQPMTFFMLLAFYLLKENKPMLSIGSLAVAVMFKQEAVFVLPAYLALYAVECRSRALKGIGFFVLILIVVSLPFLVVAPRAYIYSINYFPIGHIVNLGPSEPSLPIASGIVRTAVSMPNPLGTCGVTTLPGLYTGTICGGVENLQAFASSLVLGTLNQIASFLAPLLLVLFAAAAFVIRRAPNFAQIISAYSLLGCLLAFANLIEPALAYYFIPVYALILASVTDKRTLAVGIGTAVLSGTAPEGPFQFILPLASLFLITILQDFSSRTHDEAATSLAEGPKNVRLSKPRGLFDDARVPL